MELGKFCQVFVGVITVLAKRDEHAHSHPHCFFRHKGTKLGSESSLVPSCLGGKKYTGKTDEGRFGPNRVKYNELVKLLVTRAL